MLHPELTEDPMTDDRMALVELLQKSGDGDFLRAVAEAVLQILMEADVEGLIGAGRHERTGDRLNYRNGYRERSLDTRLGSLQLRIPKLRQGSYFPPFLEPRKTAEKALVTVIQEAWIGGVSTRRVDELVQAMGLTGISKSQVSKLCKDIDERVTAFLERPIEGEWPYLWLDATPAFAGAGLYGAFACQASSQDPRGARRGARKSALHPCIRQVRADLDHDAVMRIGGAAPGRQAHSLGRRRSHACLGSPPPRIVMSSAETDCRRRAQSRSITGYRQSTAWIAGRSTTPFGSSPVVTSFHKATSSLRASATIIVLRVAPRASAVRARYHCASALSFWNIRKRQASCSMPRRTRALPARAKPFSRRRAPLSSGDPVSPP